MVSTAHKPGLSPQLGQDKKKEKVPTTTPFTKYRFYLDVKASKVKTALISDVLSFGGTLVEFLTKEVTHVISEGPEWKFALDGSICGPPSPWTPGASPSPSTSLDGDRVKKGKTRVDSILGAAVRNQDRNGSGNTDVLDTAKKFKCRIWAFNKTLDWIVRYKRKLSHFPQLNPKSANKVKERDLRHPFIKIDSSLKYTRPAFQEFKTWPRISCDGWAGSSPFSEQKRKVKRKSIATRLCLEDKKEEAPPKKKDCPKKKEGGFCEICNKSYSELERHLKGAEHSGFIKDDSKWTEVDCKVDVQFSKASHLLY